MDISHQFKEYAPTNDVKLNISPQFHDFIEKNTIRFIELSMSDYTSILEKKQ
jgi:hypothetical protein